MGLVDAQTARGLAQRIKVAQPGIEKNFIYQHPLLMRAMKNGHIKWKGSHTEFEWYKFKEPKAAELPDWGGGELAVNTFTERDPANRAHLPYCWLQVNYGVSDRTIESNRHAGANRVYQPMAENLELAKCIVYKKAGPAIYTGGADGDGGDAPIGLKHAFGDAYETTDNVTIAASKTYANLPLNVTEGAVSAYAAAKANFDDVQWAPEAISVAEVPNVTGNGKWSEDCIIALAYMEDEMAVGADVSGTGKMQKPDLALMNRDPYHALKTKAVVNQSLYGIPAQLINTDLKLAAWNNIIVGGLTCVKDTNVPDDSGSIERVIVLDSDQWWVVTTHTKAEGLIKNDFDPKSVIITGAIGSLKLNIGFYLASPTAIGVITGCDI